MGFFDKVKKTLKFEFDHFLKSTKHVLKNPWRQSFFLNTPLGTKLLNSVTGKNYKANKSQFGGSTQGQRNEYEKKHGKGSLGFANATNTIATVIAGFYAGQGLANVGTSLASKAAAAGSSGGVNAGTAQAVGAAADAASTASTASTAANTANTAGVMAGEAAKAGAMGASTGAGSGMGTVAATAPTVAPASGGFLSGLKNFATSEGGMTLIGGALQGYMSDQQQQRALREQRQYTRPFTSEEINSITGGEPQVPGGFLDNARRVSEFLNGAPPVGASVMTPEQVAALSRGGG